MANDDEILTLLRDIRDIQQQHLEAYRAQSQRAISMSAVMVKRQRIALAIMIAIACGAAWYVTSATDVSQWKSIQDRAQHQLEQNDVQWQRYLDAKHREAPIDNEK